jgi:hypothetical protein
MLGKVLTSLAFSHLIESCAGHCGWYSSWCLGTSKAQAKDKRSHYGSEPRPRGPTDTTGEGNHA